MQNYRNILIESQIFPPIRTLSSFFSYPDVCIEACENYQKRSYRNRYRIGTTQGAMELSIPLLKGKNQQQNIRDVKIAYDINWPAQHIKAIQSSYGKSAYFVYFKEPIFELILKKEIYLFDFNWKALQLINNLIPLNLKLQTSNSFQEITDATCLDLRNKIQLKTDTPYPAYYQVFSGNTGFISNLSILDLLLHQGPEAIYYLQQIGKLTVT